MAPQWDEEFEFDEVRADSKAVIDVWNQGEPEVYFGKVTMRLDEVLTKIKGASRGQAALGALGFSAVFLALTYALVEWVFGGQIDVLFIAMEIVHFFGILVLMWKVLKEKSAEG